RREVQVGDFYLRKKCRGVLRRVVEVTTGLPARRKFLVDDFFLNGGELAAAAYEDNILKWGDFVSEAQARSLVPDLDARSAKLAQERERRRRLEAAAAAETPVPRRLRAALGR